MFMTYRELEAEQAKDLDYKIQTAHAAILQAFTVSQHGTALAFSAGKDSTVLRDLILRYFPHYASKMTTIWGNTGVEYPECIAFARQIQTEESRAGRRFCEARPAATEFPGFRYAAQRRILDRLIATDRLASILKSDGKLASTARLERLCPEDLRADLVAAGLTWPAGTRMNFWWCIDQYGWPLLGKARSKLEARRINIDCFLRYSESISEDEKLLAYYDLLREVKFSQACCNILKKEPSKRVQAGLGVDVIFKGLMASESRSRMTNFTTRGYLFQSHAPYLGEGEPFYHCNPLSIWTDEDIWAYIRRFNVPYASLYDLGFVGKDGQVHKIKRNGCMGCATDILFRNNHMATLRRTHPRHWCLFMRRGMGEQIQSLRRAMFARKRKGQFSLLDSCDAEYLLAHRPCAFDDLTDLMPGEDGDDSNAGVEFDPEED